MQCTNPSLLRSMLQVCEFLPSCGSPQGCGVWQDWVSASPAYLRCGPFRVFSMRRHCSPSCQVFFRGYRLSICLQISCVLGGGGVKVFLCHHLGPPFLDIFFNISETHKDFQKKQLQKYRLLTFSSQGNMVQSWPIMKTYYMPGSTCSIFTLNPHFNTGLMTQVSNSKRVLEESWEG